MLTLRQKFVKAAMHALASNTHSDNFSEDGLYTKKIADKACMIADAVIAYEKATSAKTVPMSIVGQNPCKEIDLPGSDSVDVGTTHGTKTILVSACNSWMELKYTINKFAPFMSHSAPATPVAHSAKDLLVKIEAVRKGEELTLITRANGLRAKVAELVWSKNYGDPWE